MNSEDIFGALSYGRDQLISCTDFLGLFKEKKFCRRKGSKDIQVLNPYFNGYFEVHQYHVSVLQARPFSVNK